MGITITFFFLFFAINLPSVQELLVRKVADFIMEKAGHRATLEAVSVSWFDTIELHGLTIYDTKEKAMITANSVDLDFHLFNLLADQSINIDKGILEHARVNMTRNAPDEQFNFTYFVDKVKEGLSRDKKKKNSRPFIVSDLRLINSEFSLDNTGRDSLTNRFDFNHFILKGINGKLENFTLKPGEVLFQTDNLTTYDSATNLNIRQLAVNYHFTRTRMVFQNLNLYISESNIENSMVFEYDSPQAMKDFVQNVKITTNIKKSLINLNDLGNFVPVLKPYDQYFRLRGYYEGQVNRFNTNNLIVEFGRSSRVEGYFNMYGLPNFFETFINANVTSASINVYDLAPYLRNEEIQNIAKFGKVNFKGRFSGFPNDFVSDGYFNTGIGDFDTDINVKINRENKDASVYSGNLKTEYINLGKLFEDTATYQNLAFEGKLSGTGFTRNSADLRLDASIKRLGYKGYEYQNIVTNARLNKDFFNGELKIEDPNLQFNGSMSIDYRGESDHLVINALLDTANLDVLKLTDKKAFVRSGLDVNLEGLQNQDLIGEANFNDLFVEYDNRQLSVSNMEILSEKDSLGRTININSSLFDTKIIGDFQIVTFLEDFSTIAYEYWLNILNNEEKLDKYYRTKAIDPKEYYYLDLEVLIKDINPIVNLALPDLKFSGNSELVGSFTGGYTNILEFQTHIDTIAYKRSVFRSNDINIMTSNFADTAQIDAEVYIHTDRIYNSRELEFEELIVDLGWHNDHVELEANIDQYQTGNYVRFNGSMDLFSNKTIFKIEPSELKALEKTWTFKDDNYIVLKNRDYEFSNIELFSENESISINGKISENSDDNLFVSIKNLDVSNINPLISKELHGRLNGFIDLRDFYKEKHLNSRINVRQFEIDNFDIGDISSAYIYENDEKRFETSISLTYKDEKTLDVDGYIYPQAEEQLRLNAEFTNTKLYILEPFYNQIVSDIEGNLFGSFSIAGRILKPIIQGQGTVDNGALTLDYQNVRYDITGEVEFDNKAMRFDNIQLTDENGSKGEMAGVIQHNFFKEPQFDFSCSFSNFQVLNTSNEDNNLFYGTAYATGDLTIIGEGKNVNFKANAVTNKDTKIFIPLNGGSEAVQEEFISFVKPRDSTDLNADMEDPFNVLDITTLNFDFDIEMTPDAYCEIIFDITSGDIIRGRGNGELKLLANTDGDFEIYGNYDISEGGYNFTLYNIINKEFQIHPDSRITWTGDPYHANLDIKASYRQLTSLYPIIDIELEEPPLELSRKYPTFVYLFIEGDMLSPEIDFEIEIEEYPENAVAAGVSLSTYVQAFYNKLQNDEQELKRQVFSLLVLKNFSPDNSFNVSNTLENSVSELVSNQLSYWITQFDENLVIDFDMDLGSMSDEQFNTFQLRLSYSFLDGRLKVTRDGNFYSQQINDNPMSLIGDWTVEYLLTEDGKFRAKVYNETNYYNYQINRRSTTSTGFSLMHTQSFDAFFERVREKRKEKLKEKDDEDTSEPEEDAITKKSINNPIPK